MSLQTQLLDGRYTLIQPLGRGAMGSVWLAAQRATGRQVAVKLMTQDLVRDEAALRRFRREARIAAQLRSRHIVLVIDYDVDPTLGPFLVMELLEGETLDVRLAREMVLPPAEVARVLRQIARALVHAHQAGVVHRDVKPENVFLVAGGDGRELVKLFDFGLAKVRQEAGLPGTQSGCVIGSLSHMSPEQTRGEEVDERSDLWSLGVLAFQCMVGRLPFHQAQPSEQVQAICHGPIPVPSALNPEVPAGFDEWVARALQRDRLLRFQSASEMAGALDSLCRPSSDRAPKPHSAETNHLFYVRNEGLTVGPLSGSLLRTGIVAGEVSTSALVWRKGWSEWIRADEIDGELLPETETASPVAVQEPHASSAPPDEGRTWSAGRIDPAVLRADPRETKSYAGNYYVSDGTTTVGPMRASQLLWGARQERLPAWVMVWREGWPRWRPLSEIFPGLRHSESS